MIATATGLCNPSGLLTGADTHGFGREASREWAMPQISQVRRAGQYAAPDAALTGEASAEPPRWAEPVATQLVGLLNLEENWDSYGGRRVDRAEVVGAFKLLANILDDYSPLPRIGPTGRGGVVIEWHQNGIDLEIETLSPHRFLVAFEDDKSSWEREIVSDFRPVVKALRRLV